MLAGMEFNYRCPRWLPDGHSQTIWSALYARAWRGKRPRYTRIRWDAPDGDFVDVDWLQSDPGQRARSSWHGADAASAHSQPGRRAGAVAAPVSAVRPAPARPCAQGRQEALLVLFHGLEGPSASHYALAMADRARELGWAFAVPMFRGCSGETNRAARAYHSGDWSEVDWILQRMQDWKDAQLGPAAPLYVAGVSLGGNALLRWAQQQGEQAQDLASAIAVISAPLDLAACGHALHRGFNRVSYERMFLSTMKHKARHKARQFPGLFDLQRVLRARSLFDFDDAFTGPLHGFEGADDYWRRASSRPHLSALRIPTLLLNARNDPFVPASVLPTRAEVPDCVTLWQPGAGGHAGFAGGHWPGQLFGMPRAVTDWMRATCATMGNKGLVGSLEVGDG